MSQSGIGFNDTSQRGYLGLIAKSPSKENSNEAWIIYHGAEPGSVYSGNQVKMKQDLDSALFREGIVTGLL